MIGPNKYRQLKSFMSDVLTEEQIKQIGEYEAKHSPKPDPEFIKKYLEKVNVTQEEKNIQLESWECYEIFKQGWNAVHSKELNLTDDMLLNLRFMNRYFSGEDFDSFLEPISSPSSDKGLLLVGGFGNGKTSVMRAYRKAFEHFRGYSFKQFSANEVVEKYELAIEGYQKREFWKEMISGVIHFDDVLTEPVSSNFGKKEIFKDIIEKRYDARLKTHMTINTRKPGDVRDAVEQLAERYGERVYDRVFEMFNVYHWKGKSFRK